MLAQFKLVVGQEMMPWDEQKESMFSSALARALGLNGYTSLQVFVTTASVTAQPGGRRRLRGTQTAWEIVLRVALINNPGISVSDLAKAVSSSPLLLKDYLAGSMCGAFCVGSRARACSTLHCRGFCQRIEPRCGSRQQDGPTCRPACFAATACRRLPVPVRRRGRVHRAAA